MVANNQAPSTKFQIITKFSMTKILLSDAKQRGLVIWTLVIPACRQAGDLVIGI
jgi:hypothetical protein